MQENNKIIIGKINGFYGLKGFVKIFSETRPRDAIFDYDHFYIQKNGVFTLLEVLSAKNAGKSLVLKFKGFEDRTSIEPYYGLDLYIDRSQLKKLKEKEYYWSDLLGLDVVNQENIHFGQVRDFIETGANDVMIVSKEREDTLIPFTQGHAVIEVDLEKNLITVDWDSDDI